MIARSRAARVVALSATAVLTLSACTATAPPDVGPTTGPVTTIDDITVSGEPGDKPKLTFPKPFSVERTVKKVLVEGDGVPLSEGINVRMHLLGVNGTDGDEFDNSYEGQPRTTRFDGESLIRGFFEALTDIRAGSRILIAVPPDDGYGMRGAPAAGIGPLDTLIFVVDVTSARKPLTRAQGTEASVKKGLPRVKLGKGGKPTVTLPNGAPPTSLVVQPLIRGSGPKVTKGQTVTAHVHGVIWPGGKVFESSWSGKATPDMFRVGVGQTLAAVDTGLVGQRIGSQLMFVIPPDQGFGAEGKPSLGIRGTDTLVIVVDVLDAG